MKEILPREYGRADSYKFLSECYYLPDEELRKELKRIGKPESLLYSEVTANVSEMDEVGSLQVDYSRLFVGPYELLAPPYGSVYLDDKKLMGDSTMDVRDWYTGEGLNIALREAPDHIAIELEFVYFLISKEIGAISSSDSGKVAYYLEKQKAFLETHLGTWVSAFASNVERYAQTEFYKNLSRATKSFVERDLKNLRELLHMGF